MADNRAEFLISSVFDPKGVKDAARAFGALGEPAEGSALKFAILNNALDIGVDLLASAGRAAFEAAQYMVELGADAEETAGLIDNSLGSAAKGFRDDIDAIAEATGRSSNALMQGSSSILAMSRSMGFGQEEAGKFTSTMSQVAVDLGSFFNQETDQVFIDLQSAMAGSAETMQKYGIDVSVTALQNAALNMGLIEQGETLDRVTRAQVLQAEIMRQAADAMGDAERTSDSYTNQSRRLQAVIQDTATEMGKELIPALTPVVTALAELATDVAPAAIEGFTEMVKTAEGAILIFGDLSSATQSLLSDFRMFTTGQDEAFIDWGAGLTMALDTVTAGQYSALKNVREGLADYADSVEVATAAQEQYANYGTDMLALQEMSAEAAREQAQAIDEVVEVNEDLVNATSHINDIINDEELAFKGAQIAAELHANALAEDAKAAEEAAKAAEEAARRRVQAETRALSQSESLFDDLYKAQEGLANAQGEYVEVWRDSSAEIEKINAELMGDLTAEQKKALNEQLGDLEEGTAEWLSTYNALQGDLTDAQRASLIAQRAELAGEEGAWQTIYTGDALAAEEAQAAIEEANAAIAQSYRDTAFEAIIAQNGFNESTAELAVNLGIMTEQEAAARLEFVNTTTAIGELTASQAFLNDTVTDQSEAVQLLSLGYASTAEEAMMLADQIDGSLSDSLITAKALTEEQIALLDELSGRKDLELNITVNGAEAIKNITRDVENLRKNFLEGGAVAQGSSTAGGSGARGGMSQTEADFLENMGGG